MSLKDAPAVREQQLLQQVAGTPIGKQKIQEAMQLLQAEAQAKEAGGPGGNGVVTEQPAQRF